MIKFDDTLMPGIKNGDSSVIEMITEEYGKQVFPLVQSMTNNSEKAFEISCEAFSLMFRSHGNFHDTASFEKQLFSSCRALCFKAHKIRTEHTDNPVLRALYSLPVKYRSVLILNDVYSFTLQQTAHLWDISEQKARQRLANGRLLVGKILKNQISE